MAISKKSLYGINALYYLSKKEPNEPTSIQEIAENSNIPKKFLEQILVELKNNDMLVSIRGNKGGYLLAKDPSQIFVIDIITALDKNFCVSNDDIADSMIKNFFVDVLKKIEQAFHVSLVDLDEYHISAYDAYMYVI